MIDKYKNTVWFRYLVIFIVCTALALFFIVQNYFIDYYFDKTFDLYHNSIFQFSYVYAWLILAPLIMHFAARFRLEQKLLYKNIPIHIGVGIIAALLHRALFMLPYVYLTSPERFTGGISKKVTGKILFGSFDSFAMYWLFIAAYMSFIYYRESRQHKIKSASLEAQVARAEVQALKMQLQPHFLFNTLHAISSLMDEDINLSRRMLARLSELLRLTLDNIGIQKVPLRQELDFLKKYLEIEQTRFSDRLKVHYNIAPETHEAMVPALVLQPLVENAVKHGIAPLARGGDIFIDIGMADEMLHISIKDNGNGTSGSGMKKSRKGVGLNNVQKRLEQMYGGKASFKTEGSAEGFFVKIVIPFEPENSGAEDGPDHSHS